MIVGLRCTAILKQKIPLKTGFFVFYADLELDQDICAGQIQPDYQQRLYELSLLYATSLQEFQPHLSVCERFIIEEGFPSRG